MRQYAYPSILFCIVMWFLIDLSRRVAMLEDDPSIDSINKKLEIHRDAISRQNAKVLSHTIGVQDRMASLENLVSQLRIEIQYYVLRREEEKAK